MHSKGLGLAVDPCRDYVKYLKRFEVIKGKKDESRGCSAKQSERKMVACGS
jgi:hypothetical protein